MEKPSDKYIPLYFVLFFLVIFIVDFSLVRIAVNSQTGVVSDKAYEEGLRYNKNIEAYENQLKNGWKGDIELASDQEIKNRVVLKISDKNNNPVKANDVKAKIIRPIGNFPEDEITLNYDKSSKSYSSAYDFKFEGAWEIKIYAYIGKDPFQVTKRFFVKNGKSG